MLPRAFCLGSDRQEAASPTLFDFKGHNIRVVDLEGTPWFVAADVLFALGYPASSTTKILENVQKKDRALKRIQGRIRPQTANIITEAGVYVLAMRSDKPEAAAFQEWVTGIVLPTIRKDGAYGTGEEKLATGGDADHQTFNRVSYSGAG